MSQRRQTLPWFVFGILASLSFVGCSGCSTAPTNIWPKKPGPKVMTSFAPLYCFAATVGGDDANVLCLLDGGSIHDYQMTARDALKLGNADLFLINGLALDDTFGTKLRDSAGNRKLKLVEVGEAIPETILRPMDADHGHDHSKCKHAHGKFDPHVWLGIPEAVLMVASIRDQLKEFDPAHAAGYESRAADYSARLKALHEEGKALLAGKQEKKIVTFHDSMAYFARAFGLEVLDSIQPMAGEEPSATHLKKLVELCQKEKVRIIAVEPNMMSNSAAKTLVDELRRRGVADAQLVEIDILESVPAQDLTPGYYEEKMRHNIQALARVLQ